MSPQLGENTAAVQSWIKAFGTGMPLLGFIQLLGTELLIGVDVNELVLVEVQLPINRA